MPTSANKYSIIAKCVVDLLSIWVCVVLQNSLIYDWETMILKMQSSRNQDQCIKITFNNWGPKKICKNLTKSEPKWKANRRTMYPEREKKRYKKADDQSGTWKRAIFKMELNLGREPLGWQAQEAQRPNISARGPKAPEACLQAFNFPLPELHLSEFHLFSR